MTQDFSGRVALVTGASRGIGYALAKALGLAGAHVVAVARTTGGLEELDDAIRAGGGSSTLAPLDLLNDQAGIDRLGGALHERFGKLDILAANAAMLGTISPLGHVEAKVFERVIGLNVTATWRVMRSMEPLLRASDAGRAVVLSSAAAQSCRPFWGPYSASKAAVEALTRTWAAELAATPVRINAVDPGVARTAMRAQAMPGEKPETLPHPDAVAAAILPLLSSATTDTGRLYIVPEKRFADWRRPE